MKETTSALLVHQNSETTRMLMAALERQGLHVTEAGSAAQAKRMLGGFDPVPLVFTDIQLLDGTWADILAMGKKAALSVNVIVVARVVDTRFYVDVIEAGAFDFIAPPFSASDLAHVTRCALDNAIARRTTHLGRRPVTVEGAYTAEVPESVARLATR